MVPSFREELEPRAHRQPRRPVRVWFVFSDQADEPQRITRKPSGRFGNSVWLTDLTAGSEHTREQALRRAEGKSTARRTSRLFTPSSGTRLFSSTATCGVRACTKIFRLPADLDCRIPCFPNSVAAAGQIRCEPGSRHLPGATLAPGKRIDGPAYRNARRSGFGV